MEVIRVETVAHVGRVAPLIHAHVGPGMLDLIVQVSGLFLYVNQVNMNDIHYN